MENNLSVGFREALTKPLQALEKFDQRKAEAKNVKAQGADASTLEKGVALTSRIVACIIVPLSDIANFFKEAGLTVTTTVTGTFLAIPQLIQWARGKEIPGKDWGFKAMANHAFRTVAFIALSPTSFIVGLVSPTKVKEMHVKGGFDNNQVLHFHDLQSIQLIEETVIFAKLSQTKEKTEDAFKNIGQLTTNSTQAKELLKDIKVAAREIAEAKDELNVTFNKIAERGTSAKVMAKYEQISKEMNRFGLELNRMSQTSEDAIEMKEGLEKAHADAQAKETQKKLDKAKAQKEKEAKEAGAKAEANKGYITKAFDFGKSGWNSGLNVVKGFGQYLPQLFEADDVQAV